MSAILKIFPILLLAVFMFYFPQEVLKSASSGLNLWVNYVLPALFPFFVISDLLMKLGFVQFLGVLLEPLMRPLFRLPGKAAFVIAMTHSSGIPIGAILTSKMRQNGEITQIEGERLLAFSSNPSPGFMFGAVASGMLANPNLGIVIAGSVYIANLIVGLIFRFYGNSANNGAAHSFSFRRAFREMETSQKKISKPFGELLAMSVRESINTILLVGGFIVFFSVITHLLTILHVDSLLAQGLSGVTGGFLNSSGINAIFQGFLETTLGCKAVVESVNSLNVQIGLISLLLGWGGLSVFAQVGSFTTATDLRFAPFIVGRFLHSVLALFISQLFLFYTDIPTMVFAYPLQEDAVWLSSLHLSAIYFTCLLLLLLGLGLTLRFWRRIK